MPASPCSRPTGTPVHLLPRVGRSNPDPGTHPPGRYPNGAPRPSQGAICGPRNGPTAPPGDAGGAVRYVRGGQPLPIAMPGFRPARADGVYLPERSSTRSWAARLRDCCSRSRNRSSAAVPVDVEVEVGAELGRDLLSPRRLHDLRHSSASITANLYVHLLRSAGQHAAETVAAAIPRPTRRPHHVLTSNGENSGISDADGVAPGQRPVRSGRARPRGAEARGFEPRRGYKPPTALAVRRHRPD